MPTFCFSNHKTMELSKGGFLTFVSDLVWFSASQLSGEHLTFYSSFSQVKLFMCHTRRIHREILFQCSDPEPLQFNVSA